MKFFKPQQEQTADENIFWASMSDLLLGLLIVFIILFVLAMMGFTKQKMDEENVKSTIVTKLSTQFKKQHIPIEIDKFTGSIKISDLELFELNEWKISDKGGKFLKIVLPTYFNVLLNDPKIKDHISEIIIEGHTDTQDFKGTKSKYENYTKNLDLSLKRAFSVTDFIINTDFQGKNMYKDNLIKLLSINGKSYSKPVFVNGKEDFTKSRRVELKFQLKDFNYIDLIKKAYKSTPLK